MCSIQCICAVRHFSSGALFGSPMLEALDMNGDSKGNLANFPQLIMSGETKDGGLVSLTFKSIKTADLVDNLEMMRQTLIRPTDEYLPTRISKDKFDPDSVRETLQKTSEPVQHTLESAEITAMHRQLAANHQEVGAMLAQKLAGDGGKTLAVAETIVRSIEFGHHVDVAPQ